MTPAGSQARPTRLNLLVRSALTSVALLLLSLPTLAAVGGYVPQILPIAGFGRLLGTTLPWLFAGAAIALVLALIALRIGGGRFTALLTALSLAVVVALANVGIQFAALAAQHGATYDVLRQASSVGPPIRTADERIVYAEVEGQELHAELWHAAPPATAGVLRPGVLFIHGGGFTHGAPGMRPLVLARFADAGYAAADIEYRLAPPPRWQDARADVLCALGWFQSVAPTYGVDPAKVVVMGESAGGNLALVAAYTPGAPGGSDVQPSCDVNPLPPAGVIAVYPTADLVATWEDVVRLGDPTPFPEVYTGGTPAEVPDRYAAASVARLLRTALPTTLLITGTNDQLVRIERMRALAEAIRHARSEVELIEVPFSDHAFDGPPNGFGMQLEETILLRFVLRVGSPGGA